MVGRLQTEIKHFFTILFLLYFVSGCKPNRDTTDLFYYQTDSIQAGDIILRKSYGVISDIITSQLKDTIEISHCGIIAQNEQGHFYVIHTLSKMVSDFDGMQSCSIERFIDDSRPETVQVVRFRNPESRRIADYASYHLKALTPFDEKFDQNDSTAFYCSELPIHIIKQTFGVDISHNAHKPKFSVFFQPEYFTNVNFMQKKSPEGISNR